PRGRCLLEGNGTACLASTFMVPGARKTYLVHCDVPRQTEKGMRAQLKVGGGNGDLPSIPGVTGPRQPDLYPVRWSVGLEGATLLAGLVGAALAIRGLG